MPRLSTTLRGVQRLKSLSALMVHGTMRLSRLTTVLSLTLPLSPSRR